MRCSPNPTHSSPFLESDSKQLRPKVKHSSPHYEKAKDLWSDALNVRRKFRGAFSKGALNEPSFGNYPNSPLHVHSDLFAGAGGADMDASRHLVEASRAKSTSSCADGLDAPADFEHCKQQILTPHRSERVQRHLKAPVRAWPSQAHGVHQGEASFQLFDPAAAAAAQARRKAGDG